MSAYHQQARRRIDSIESLREHLQWAVEIEHSTLPPYLCALYSLDPARNPAAVEVLTSVFVEEMLHLTLAANLLNAVGGKPVLDAPHLLPGYPSPLPHADTTFEVSLVPFGNEALDLFLRIEKPSLPDAPAESGLYETIGQFYHAVEDGLRHLCDSLGEARVFSGDPARQVTSDAPYRGGGAIIAVRDLATALRALSEIVEQGEGAAHRDVWDGDHQLTHPDRDEVGHYYRFLELKLGRRYQSGDTPSSGPTGAPVQVDWDGVAPMQRNPRITDNPTGSDIRAAQEQFNRAYCDLLGGLEMVFNGEPSLLHDAVGAMYGLKKQAQALLRMPAGGGRTAGPTFEYVALAQR